MVKTKSILFTTTFITYLLCTPLLSGDLSIVLGDVDTEKFPQICLNISVKDSSGKKMWQKYHGGKREDRGYAISQCKDGGYIIAGETSSYGNGKNDILVIKTNSIGNRNWRSTFGGNGVDIGRSIKELPQGGFILSGTSTISNLSFDAIMIKTNAKGESGKYSQ